MFVWQIKVFYYTKGITKLQLLGLGGSHWQKRSNMHKTKSRIHCYICAFFVFISVFVCNVFLICIHFCSLDCICGLLHTIDFEWFLTWFMMIINSILESEGLRIESAIKNPEVLLRPQVQWSPINCRTVYLSSLMNSKRNKQKGEKNKKAIQSKANNKYIKKKKKRIFDQPL